MRITTIITVLVLVCVHAKGQSNDSLTADQIVEKSIQYIGNAADIEKIKTVESSYCYYQSEKNFISIIEKRTVGQSYMHCILSKKHYPKTTIINNNEACVIENDKITHILDEDKLAIMALKTYTHIQLGYKRLGFTYERLADDDFKNYNFYVVKASNKTGYKTLNYFDKTNFKLLMVIYPNGNRSLEVEDTLINGIKFNKRIINNENGEITERHLVEAEINKKINDLWFKIPKSNTVVIPENIRVGTFKSIMNSDITLERTKTTQTEVSNGDNYFMNVNWTRQDTFELTDVKVDPKDKDPSAILVHIISWDDNHFVCHYMNNTVFGDEEYVRIK